MKKTLFGLLFAFLSLSALSWCVADTLLGLTLPAGETLAVPDFIGRDEAEVRNYDWLDAVITYRYDETAPGTVLSQDPPPGSLRKRNDRLPARVRLVVSLGTEKQTVPDLAGSDAHEGAARLRAAGFAVEEIRIPGGTAGTVDRVEPPAGTELEAGATVRLYIHAGQNVRTVAVPDLIGLSRSDALLRIFRAGLTVTEETGETYGGTVVGQSPTAGSVVTVGSRVTITVETGSTEQTAP